MEIKQSGISIEDIQFYVLNLDRRPDRMEEITPQLFRENISFKRIPAIDGKKVDPMDYGLNINFSDIKGPGILGCILSHRKIWQYVVSCQNEYAIVLEDDAILEQNFLVRLQKVLNEISTIEVDFLYLGAYINNRVPEQITKNIATIDKAYCTHAYMISKKSAQMLLDKICPKWWPVDNQIADFAELKKYLVYPNMANQSGSVSDIAK